MFRVCKGQKILNVKTKEIVKSFYENEILPEDYNPPEDYITNGIIEKIDNETTSKFIKKRLETKGD